MEVKAGELIDVVCPEGKIPALVPGDKFPPDKPLFVVVSVQKDKIQLGPLRAGDHEIDIPCSEGSSSRLSYSLKALKKEELPPKSGGLSPYELTYPLWLWILILLIVALILGSLFAFFYNRNKRRPRILPPAPQMSPQQKLENFIQEAGKSKVYESDDPKSILIFYQQGYEALRRFLEDRFQLNTRFETTREFVGTLRAVAVQWKLAPGTVDQVEALLVQSDDVRFAHAAPSAEIRKSYFEKVKELAHKLRSTEAGLGDQKK